MLAPCMTQSRIVSTKNGAATFGSPRSGSELSGDGEMIGGLPGLVARHHLDVSRFDMAGHTLAIEQGRLQTALGEALPDGGQPVRMGRQFQRGGLVTFEVRRDQFRQSDRRQHAGRDPAGEGVTEARQDRQAGPERLDGGDVGVIGQAVEKQIRQPLPRQMIGMALDPRGEYQAFGRDADFFGCALKIGLGYFVRLQQPQHAARNLVE
jgi:hypothetical protein